MKKIIAQWPYSPAKPALALGLFLLLLLLSPQTGLAAKAGSEDTVLYYLIESQRRDAKVCNGMPMPEAQSLIPSVELSDLAAASVESGTAPEAFVQANGLDGTPFLLARVPGNTPRQAFENLLSKQCAEMMDPAYRYVGSSLHDGQWTLLLSAKEPGSASGAQNADAGKDEPILLAANGGGSTLPVIPKVPERSKRAPRRPVAPDTAPEPEAAPVASPQVVKPPVQAQTPAVSAPDPVPAVVAPKPRGIAPAPRPEETMPDPTPRVAAPAPKTAPETPVEPEVPSPPAVVATPAVNASPLPFEEEPKPRPRRTRRYDPNLVKDPSAATPYITREIEVAAPSPYPTDRPVWMVEVPTPGPGPAPIVVSPMPEMPPAARIAAGTPAGSAVPLYSTQPFAVSGAQSSYEPSPSTAALDASGQPVGGHGAYPGAVSSPWPSESAVVYTGVPPERTQYALGSERPRPRPDYVPSLPPERISSPLPMEAPWHEPRALRPRR